ncbi:MAG: DUF418 domain-containing protein [Caulobacteraceae bacterium]
MAQSVTGNEEEVTESSIAPIGKTQRLAVLDVLRGFALLGILMMNIEDFSGPNLLPRFPIGIAKAAFIGWHANLDYFILAAKWLFFEGKMRGMFSLLFGASAVLLIERIERRGRSDQAADIFLRRNMWLVLIGFIHGALIWDGDILIFYGLCGLLILFPFRNVGPKKLIALGLTVWLVGGTLAMSHSLHIPKVMEEGAQLAKATAAKKDGAALTKAQQAMLDADAKKKIEAKKNIDQDILKGRAGYVQSVTPRFLGRLRVIPIVFTSGRIAETIGAMLLGMGLYRNGFLSGRRSTRAYLATAAAGYAITVPIVLVGLWQTKLGGFSFAAAVQWMYLPYCIEQAPGTLANAAIVILLVRSRYMRSAFNALGAVGRTALSNYILTSVACQFIFAWGPWKLYGTLEYYQCVLVVATIWSANLLLSSLWLRVFVFGPLEWAWRSLTYWRWQPLISA